MVDVPAYAAPIAQSRRPPWPSSLFTPKYDRDTERAYVELRDEDDDGGEILAVAVFSFRTTTRLSKQQIEQDIVRKARHLLKRAGGAI